MIKKKMVSIVIPATKLEELKKCVASVFEYCVEKETQIIVAYPKEKTEIKIYMKELKKKHHVLGVPTNLKYAYPHLRLLTWIKKLLIEMGLQKRKVAGEFMSDVVQMTALYQKGIFFAYGKYLLYLSQEMRMEAGFWEACILPLKKKQSIGSVVVLARQRGEDVIFEDPIYKGPKEINYPQGTRSVLYGLHTMSYAIIWKRKRLKETKKYIQFTTADAYYFMEMNLLIRMQEADTLVISEPALSHELSTLHKKSFDNLKYPVERLAFLRGLRRYFGTIIVKRKIDIQKLVQDIEYCENDYREFLDCLITYYEKNDTEQTAVRYHNLKESLLVVEEE